MRSVRLFLSVLGFAVATAASATAQSAAFTMSNASAGNEVLAYDRAPDGTLSLRAAYSTGGAGTGGGIGSQGAVSLSQDGRWLLVVNAGSNSVSVFENVHGALVLRDVESSLGNMPTSVDQQGHLVYVLNAASPNNVAGFWLGNDGQLTAIAGALRPLSAATTDPAQVAIAPDGKQLVVTERATNLIDVFPIEGGGVLGAPTFVPSAGITPFGFEFGHRGTLIVSEAFAGAHDASAVSSYDLSQAGVLGSVSPSVPTTETSACWIAITRSGRYAYASNTGSGTVSGYGVSHTGAIDRLDDDGVTGNLGAGTNPGDASITRDDRFLYVLSPATHEIAIFAVRHDGSLEKRPSLVGIPSTARGLVAR